MNFVGIIITVGIIAIVGVGYFTYTGKESAMMEKDTMGETLPDTPSGALDAAEEAKMMMEEKDMEAEKMMDNKMEREGEMKKDDMMEEGSMMKKDDMMKKDEGAMMQKPGTYEAYAAGKLANANSGDVVLFFRASWCPTCKALDANLKANAATIPSDLTILDVDYDNSAELKKKYGVTYQHTLVQVDASGNQIAKWSGSRTIDDIVAQVK